MSGYRWLLFDADGTLFDYDRAEAAALTATWEEMGLAPVDGLVARYREINARLWEVYEAGGIAQQDLQVERFARLVDELGGELDGKLDGEPDGVAGAARLSDAYLVQLARQTFLLDGARELLEWARERFRLALITNGIPEVQRPRIRRTGFDRLFEAVVISGEEGVAKPAPEIFDIARERMGGPPRAEILLVGDSLSSDVRGGVDYGIDTCWLNPAGEELGDGPEPRYEIRRIADLRQILG